VALSRAAMTGRHSSRSATASLVPSATSCSACPDLPKPLTKVQTLLLSGEGITDAGLKTLGTFKPLMTLNLRGTGITDAGLEHLKKATGLKRLYLEGTKVSGRGVAQLRQDLPGTLIYRTEADRWQDLRVPKDDK
jgi:hypothetical protein